MCLSMQPCGLVGKNGLILCHIPAILIRERCVSFVGLIFLPFSFQRTPGLKGQRSGSYPLPLRLRASKYRSGEDAESPLGIIWADRGIECPTRPALNAAAHARAAVTAVTRSGSLKTKVLNTWCRTCAHQSCIFGEWGLMSALVGTIMLAAGWREGADQPKSCLTLSDQEVSPSSALLRNICHWKMRTTLQPPWWPWAGSQEDPGCLKTDSFTTFWGPFLHLRCTSAPSFHSYCTPRAFWAARSA